MAKKEISQAAEKVAAAEKKKDKKPANPNGNVFQRAGKAIKKFCKDLKGEIKKIVWPDRNTVLKSTGVVLVAVIICGAAIFGVDQLLALIIGLLKKAAESCINQAKCVAVAAESLSASNAEAETTTAAAMMAIKSFFIG